MARPFLRQLGTVAYSSGQVSRLELPRNHVFKSLFLELTGTMTTTGGTTSGTLHDEEPQSLIRSIRIVRNGSEVLQDLTGPEAYEIARFNWGGPGNRTPIGSNAAGTYNFRADLRIDFSSERLWTPSMTLLKAVGPSSLFLEITWGGNANLISGGDRTNTLSNTQVVVHGVEIMDVTGRFGDKILRPVSKQGFATSTDLEVQLQIGPLYRRIFFRTSQSTDFDLYDACVNSVRMIVDGTLYLADRLKWTALRGMNKQQFNLETVPSGYAVLDFAEDGNPQGLLVTAGASEVKLLLDVTAGTAVNEIRVIPEMFVPPTA